MAEQPHEPVLVERLRAAVRSALKAHDRTALSSLRSAIAAIENAAAVRDGSTAGPSADGPIAKALSGVGVADVPRRELTDEDILGILHAEVTERRSAATDYRRTGRDKEAQRLEAEAQRLESFLPD